jgi:YVTN family beta-propeller protein
MKKTTKGTTPMKVFKTAVYLKRSAARCTITLLLAIFPLVLSAAEPWVYVTNNRSDSLSIISTATDEVLTTIRVGKEPHEVAITPDGNRVLVCNAQDNTVSVIDSNVQVAIIPTERYPHGVQKDSNSNFL